MNFIEGWLHISPDGGSGLSEALILALLIAIPLIILILRNYIPKNFTQFLEQFGKRQSSDRFDN